MKCYWNGIITELFYYALLIPNVAHSYEMGLKVGFVPSKDPDRSVIPRKKIFYGADQMSHYYERPSWILSPLPKSCSILPKSDFFVMKSIRLWH